MWKSFFLPAVIASSFAAGALFYKVGNQLEWWPSPSPVQDSQVLETSPLAVEKLVLVEDSSDPTETPPIISQEVQSRTQPVTDLIVQSQIDTKGYEIDTESNHHPRQEEIEKNITAAQAERLVEDTDPLENDKLVEFDDLDEIKELGKIEVYPDTAPPCRDRALQN